VQLKRKGLTSTIKSVMTLANVAIVRFTVQLSSEFEPMV
jgi:hypothetical protein